MVYSYQDLISAWNKVKENRGCAGADCVTLEEFEQDLDGNLHSLQKQLANGDYSPLPVLRVYIDKEDGGKRSIGIPAVRDRIVQQVLLSFMSPIFEKEFLDCSFAYRPGRSALVAIDRTEALIKKESNGFLMEISRNSLIQWIMICFSALLPKEFPIQWS